MSKCNRLDAASGLTVPQTANRDALIAARQRAGLTRREAAAVCGVNRTTVRDWERGTQRPPAPRVVEMIVRLDAAAQEQAR